MARLYRSLGSEVTTFSAKSCACPEVHWLRNGNDGWTMALATRAAWRRLELVGERELEIQPPGHRHHHWRARSGRGCHDSQHGTRGV